MNDHYSNFRKTFHDLFLEYGELPALPILQITFNLRYTLSTLQVNHLRFVKIRKTLYALYIAALHHFTSLLAHSDS